MQHPKCRTPCHQCPIPSCSWAPTTVGGLWARPTGFLPASSGGSPLLHCCETAGMSFAMHCVWVCPLPGFLQSLTAAGLSMLSGYVFSKMHRQSQQAEFQNWLLQASGQLGWRRAGHACPSSIRPAVLLHPFQHQQIVLNCRLCVVSQ